MSRVSCVLTFMVISSMLASPVLAIGGDPQGFVPGRAAAANSNAPRNLRVLFIGNSFTHINDLPLLTASLAASANPPRQLYTQLVAEGGATLKRHWEAGAALVAIRQGKWDYVVLQEQGNLGPSVAGSINEPQMFHEYARRFDSEIRKAGARTVLFMTWARQDAPEQQVVLTKAYADIAEELHVTVAPVGLAWEKSLRHNPKLTLHYTDRSHPGPLGSYLSACVLFAVLFSSSPEGLSAGDLRTVDAASLQRIAWDISQNPAKALADSKTQPPRAATRAASATFALTPVSSDRGRAVLAAAQKAAGGLERLRALKDYAVSFTGKLISPYGEMLVEGREVLVFPSLLRTDMRSAAGTVATYFDGTDGWRKGPQGLPKPLPENMKKGYGAQIVRNTFILLRAEGDTSVTFESRERLGDAEADVIAVSGQGESVRLFVDVTTGTLLKKSYRGAGMGGPADLEEIYSDYREISGVRIPFRVETRQNGAPFLAATVSEAKVDSGIDPTELAKQPQ
ncbi:MAG TPA: hypothetical protein VM056_06380 [Terriglobales bacterium]|nr:hypothetical protein [Terriglobales bacterium]